MNKKLKALQSGQVSKIFIILAAAILVVIIIIFAVMGATRVKKPSGGEAPAEGAEPQPVYETTIGDIRFLYESARDLGRVITAKTYYEQKLTTTDKFVKVVIGAQNKGKRDTEEYLWDVGNIVDSAGRNFVSINNEAYGFLPQPDLCGAVLKPEFEPTPCVKLYEVSAISGKLKVDVSVRQGGAKKQKAYIDLIVTK